MVRSDTLGSISQHRVGEVGNALMVVLGFGFGDVVV